MCLRCTRTNSCLEKSLRSANTKETLVPPIWLLFTDLTTQLGHLRTKGWSSDSQVHFSLWILCEYSIPVSNFLLFVCTRCASPSTETKALWEHTKLSYRFTVLKRLLQPTSTGTGHNSPIYHLTHHGQVSMRKTFSLFGGFFLFVFLTRSKAFWLKNPLGSRGTHSNLVKLQNLSLVFDMCILTMQVLELAPMKESLSTCVSLLSRKGVWDLFCPKARMHS